MKIHSFIILLISVFFVFSPPDVLAQNFTSQPRTPEQEATRQTERLKADLKLTPTQEKLVYNINLKYEQQRQLANDRKKALERVKARNEELKKALTAEQYILLQNKRTSNSTSKSPPAAE